MHAFQVESQPIQASEQPKSKATPATHKELAWHLQCTPHAPWDCRTICVCQTYSIHLYPILLYTATIAATPPPTATGGNLNPQSHISGFQDPVTAGPQQALMTPDSPLRPVFHHAWTLQASVSESTRPCEFTVKVLVTWDREAAEAGVVKNRAKAHSRQCLSPVSIKHLSRIPLRYPNF